MGIRAENTFAVIRHTEVFPAVSNAFVSIRTGSAAAAGLEIVVGDYRIEGVEMETGELGIDGIQKNVGRKQQDQTKHRRFDPVYGVFHCCRIADGCDVLESGDHKSDESGDSAQRYPPLIEILDELSQVGCLINFGFHRRIGPSGLQRGKSQREEREAADDCQQNKQVFFIERFSHALLFSKALKRDYLSDSGIGAPTVLLLLVLSVSGLLVLSVVAFKGAPRNSTDLIISSISGCIRGQFCSVVITDTI